MISILMPIYNGVEFIRESIPSVFSQTVDSWELLIAINGHPPNSTVYQEVLNYILTLNDSRIRLFDFHMCKGKSETLNKMISECAYTYVALLDVDDIWLPRKLEAQLPFCQTNENYDVIGTKCVYFGDINNIVPNIPTGDITSFNFFKVNPVINSSSLIKKKLASWHSSTMLEDYDLWLRLWKQKYRFYNCDDVLVKHRIHQSSAFNAKGNGNHVVDLIHRHMGDTPTPP
jgi:glycosyltransferase involved in cell wall biosynthesis